MIPNKHHRKLAIENCASSFATLGVALSERPDARLSILVVDAASTTNHKKPKTETGTANR